MSVGGWTRLLLWTLLLSGAACGGNGGAPQLTVQKQGEGTITSNPAGIACGAGCAEQKVGFASGTTVSLGVAPAPGWQFDRYLGDGACESGEVLVNRDILCVVSFTRSAATWNRSYPLELTVGLADPAPPSIVVASDGSPVVGVTTTGHPQVLRFSPDGELRWAREMRGLGTADALAAVGDEIIAAGAPAEGLVAVARLDGAGNALWSSRYGTGFAGNAAGGIGLASNSAGDVYIRFFGQVGLVHPPGAQPPVLDGFNGDPGRPGWWNGMVLAAAGEVVLAAEHVGRFDRTAVRWQYVYADDEPAAGIVGTADGVVVWGRGANVGAGEFREMSLRKLDLATGAQVWSRSYAQMRSGLRAWEGRGIALMPDGGVVVGLSNPAPVIVRVGPDGTLRWALELPDLRESGSTGALTTDGAGSIYAVIARRASVSLIKLDADGESDGLCQPPVPFPFTVGPQVPSRMESSATRTASDAPETAATVQSVEVALAPRPPCSPARVDGGIVATADAGADGGVDAPPDGSTPDAPADAPLDQGPADAPADVAPADAVVGPPRTWSRTYAAPTPPAGDGGGLPPSAPNASAIVLRATSDGGYAALFQVGGGALQGIPMGDVHLAKLDASGGVVWTRNLGTSPSVSKLDLLEAPGGGYFILGVTSDPDLQLTRVDASGAVLWAKTYGDASNDYPIAFALDPAGGVLILANVAATGENDVSVIKVDAAGAAQWHRRYGGDGEYQGAALHPAAGGGFILTGSRRTDAFEDMDVWVAKLDAAGDMSWQRTYGTNPSGQSGIDGISTHDGGFLVVANQDPASGFQQELLVLKLAANGDLDWQSSYGATANTYIANVSEVADGYLVLSATNDGLGGPTQMTSLYKIGQSGGLTWNKTYQHGSGLQSAAWSMTSAAGGGGVLVAGETITGSPTARVAWLLSLDADGSVTQVGCPVTVGAARSATASAAAHTQTTRPNAQTTAAPATITTVSASSATVAFSSNLQCGN